MDRGKGPLHNKMVIIHFLNKFVKVTKENMCPMQKQADTKCVLDKQLDRLTDR